MKAIAVKSVVILVVVLGLVNYVVYLQTGQMPVIKFAERISDFSLSLPDMPDVKLPETIKQLGNSTDLLPATQTRIYKWTDRQGVVHYGEEPPPDGHAEMLMIDSNTNLVKGLAPEEFVSAAEQQAAGGRAFLIDDGVPAESTGIDTESPPLEQTHQAKKLLEQRNQNQQNLLDNL